MEEELENQQSWRDDDTKCTFIVLARDACGTIPSGGADDSDFVTRNLHAMVGDVNLFLSDEEDEEEVDPFAPPKELPPPQKQAEVDIMIAESAFHGKGLGKEATSLMMLFGAKKLGFRRYFCKINEDNAASKSLFENKLGFIEKQYVAVFKQYELELKKGANHDLEDYLSSRVDDLRIFECPLELESDPATEKSK